MGRIHRPGLDVASGTSVTIKPTLIPFPTKWDTSLANFVSEPDFNAILTELGRLAAADSNLEQAMFDALSYLIDKNDFGSAVKYVNAQFKNSFDGRKALLLVLHKSRVQNQIERAELEEILKEAKLWHDRRNEYVHARWCIPNKAAGGVVRIKFDPVISRDKAEPITRSDLTLIVTSMEDCTEHLNKFFGAFGDYHQWLIKRMPPA
jgi:hypothetical protein